MTRAQDPTRGPEQLHGARRLAAVAAWQRGRQLAAVRGHDRGREEEE